MYWRDYLMKEVKHVRLGRNIFNNRHNSSGIRIWRDRRCVGGNCQVPIPSVSGDVHHLCDFRLERQRSFLINGTARFNPYKPRNEISLRYDSYSPEEGDLAGFGNRFRRQP